MLASALHAEAVTFAVVVELSFRGSSPLQLQMGCDVGQGFREFNQFYARTTANS